MKPKFYLAASVVLMLVFVLVSGTAAAQPANPCDHDYVVRSGNIIRVSPTGVDDTANFQCAFDLAIAENPGKTVFLMPGTFHTAQVVANDFHGTFRGSGINRTVIVNLPDLYVTPHDYYLNPPSAANPIPVLISFVDGDLKVLNLTVRVVGQAPTTGWSQWDWPTWYEMVAAIAMYGEEAHAQVYNVWVVGEPSDTSIFDYNLFNGVYFNGFMGESLPPLSGTFRVTHSTFKRVGSGTPLANLKNATVVLSHNTYEEVQEAVDGSDFSDTSIMIFHNRINASVVGLWFYPWTTPAIENSVLTIRGNIFKGPVGISLDQPMDEASTCLIKNNKLQWVTDTPIYLGPGTEDCVLENNRE